MDHQSQVEKPKYRNWVRGGLTYSYLKEGIEGFIDEVVIQEHNRILQKVNHRRGLTCNQCNLRNLKPLHNSKTNLNTGKTVCPWGQVNCNCLFKNKRPCRNKVCDAIFEEILETHWSTPPSPNWKNVDIEKWCSTPWEIAKCFINAPGYADKTTASDIDAPGLLHLFINNINLQTNLACKITGTDVLNRVLKRRNTIFHSSTMELEDKELDELINDIIEILEDEKKLKANHDAIKAVEKLKQLKRNAFIITTRDEVEVCRATMASIDMKKEELESQLKQTADNANIEIDTNRSKALKSIHDTTEDTKKDIEKKESLASKLFEDKLEQASKNLNKQNDNQFQAQIQTIGSLTERVRDLEQDTNVAKQRLAELESSVKRIDIARTARQKQLDYVNQKQACQRKLLHLYQKHYVKTMISPLRKQDNDININEVYVTSNMTVEKQKEYKTAEGKSSSKNDKELNRYRDIFQTDGSLHKKIYIVGDVGSGKSSLGKMMLYNWCKAIESEDETNATHANDKAPQPPEEFDDINEIKRFNFVFFISLQRMSGQSSSFVEMIRLYYKDIVTSELLDRILAEESKHCLIIADGLDEWTPSKTEFFPEHVSYGLPLTDGLPNSTVITLSRPSARGLLSMKTSEYDLKIMLQGIDSRFIGQFIEKYMSKQSRNQDSCNSFLYEIRMNNLEHLVKTPLLLQQLVWMYCMGHGIGKTVSEIYSNVVNVMFGWLKNKDNLRNVSETEIKNTNDFQEMQLPVILKRLPRCEANKIYILQLGKIAFNALTAEISTSVFGPSSLLNVGLSTNDITTLTSVGVLVECNCIDPTYEDVYFSFIHTSYLEFFAAVYISSQNSSTTVLEELFKKYKLLSDLLQLYNLLKLLLELSPNLLKDISKLISISVANDENVLRYRTNLEDELACIPYEAEQLQRLIYNCLCEYETDDQPVASICDIAILYGHNMSILRNIIPSSVLSLNFYPSLIHFNESQYILKWAVHLPRLQYICINRKRSYEMQCSLVQKVALFIQKIVSLKHISLKHVTCFDPNCKGHVIDLSKHNQLQSIHLEDCLYRVISFEKSENLKHIYISDSINLVKRVVHEQLISSLTKAVSLKHITLKGIKCSYTDCSGLTFDFSEHFQLHSIHLEMCPFQVGSLGNTEYLENVYISHCLSYKCDSCSAQYEMIGKLASSLTQAVSLVQLTLKFCNKTCNIYGIDLSKHDQLRSLEVLKIPEHLDVVNIRATQNLSIPAHLFALPKSLCDISKLNYLKIRGESFTRTYDLYTISMNSIVQALQQLQSLSLSYVNVDDNALIVSPKMKKLRKISMFDVYMRQDKDCSMSETNVPTWRSFIDSLFTLEQSVQVETDIRWDPSGIALRYIRRDKLCRLRLKHTDYYIFET